MYNIIRKCTEKIQISQYVQNEKSYFYETNVRIT